METNEKTRESSFTATVKAEKENKDEKMNVSSTAIVKYESQLSVLPYAKLRQDTDLNIAPENWLRDGRFSNAFPTNRNPLEFSSFGIAHMFLDTIGDVDVISDAENIKKLLKMAYSKAELSLVVHRIGKTLLLDELDLPGIFTYVSQTKNLSSLKWLYDFYCKERGIPKDRDLKKKKNKHEAKQKNIFSKFLHYSIQQEQDGQEGSSLFSEPSTTPESQHHVPLRSPGNEFPVGAEETTLKSNQKYKGKEPEPKPETEHFSSGTSSPSCTEKLNVFPENKEDALPEKSYSSHWKNEETGTDTS